MYKIKASHEECFRWHKHLHEMIVKLAFKSQMISSICQNEGVEVTDGDLDNYKADAEALAAELEMLASAVRSVASNTVKRIFLEV